MAVSNRDGCVESRTERARRPAARRHTYEVYTPVKEGTPAAHLDLSSYADIANRVAAEGFVGTHWLAEVIRRLPIKGGHLAVGITDGPVAIDKAQGVSAACQTFRQSHFPVALLRCVEHVRVEVTSATVADDKRHILNYIAGRRGDELDLVPLEASEAYDAFDETLYCRHLAAGWRLLTESGVDLSKPSERLGASNLHRLVLSFRGCDAFDDRAAQLLARSLPKTLRHLKLEVEGSRVSAEGAIAVLDAVVARLQLSDLQLLSMSDCRLSVPLPPQLGTCTQLGLLNFAGNRMCGPVPPELRRCVQLRSVFLQNNELTGALPAWLGEWLLLESLSINGNQLEGAVPGELGRCTALRELRIHQNPQLAGPLPSGLGSCGALIKLEADQALLRDGLPTALHARRERGELHVNKPRWRRPEVKRYYSESAAQLPTELVPRSVTPPSDSEQDW